MPISLQNRRSLHFKPLSKRVSTKRVHLTETSTLTNKEEMVRAQSTQGQRWHQDHALTTFNRQGFPPKAPLINNLPVELQVEIFSQCLSPLPTFSIDEAPLSIARVCRAWNHLVFHSPKLWSAFEIKIEGRTKSISPGRVESIHTKVKQWLLRSKQCPLSIRVSRNLVSRFGEFKQLVSLLETEAHRWKHIEFTFPAIAIQHILTDNLPALQSLVLRLTGHSTSLSLDRALHHIPWRQITLLDLQPEDPSQINLDGCLDILSQTERLKECTLKVDCTMNLHDNHQHCSTGVSLPLLDKLTLNLHRSIRTRTGSPEGCLAQFLNTITVPRLETLHLGWYASGPNQNSDSWTAHHSEFLSFFTSITKTMRSFSIAYLPFSEKELRQCLSCLKNLTHLVLKYPLSDAYDDPVTSSFLSSFTFPAIFDAKDARPTDPPLLPMLEHCEVEGHGRGYTSAGIVAFIESRSNGALCQDIQLGMIKSCRIFSTNVTSDEMEDYVRKWKKRGMEISIGSLVIR